MESESSGGCLDDLRKKRLAYFQMPQKTDTHSPDIVEGQGNQSSTSISKQDLLTTMKTSITPVTENIAWNGEEFKNISNGNASSVKETTGYLQDYSNSDAFNKKQNESSAAMPLRTSAFYFANPEKREKEQGTGTRASAKAIQEGTDGLDAYNETVERLIRATKEEILGQKSSDDIWKQFTKDSSKEDEQYEKTINVDDRINSSSVTVETFVEKSRNKSVVEVAENEFESPLKQEEFSENMVRDANENLAKDNDHDKQRTQKIPLDSYKARPLYSNSEPSQKFHGEQSELQKSYTTSKVEEIFSSRQITQSQLQKSVSFIDSQEFEPIKEVISETVENSQDFSELGLSTHRPESDRQDDFKVVGDEANLGDTVTKELRTVLGEEKFQEFLMKAKRDIADLHQEHSGRKDKTPRLMKEKQTKSRPETPKSRSEANKSKDFENEKPKSILKYRENAQQNDLPTQDSDNVKSDYKPDSRRQRSLSESLRSSTQDFTPRQSDGDAVEHMIGEYLLNKSDTVESRDQSVNKSVETSPVAVPKLDLAGVTKPEISRPKLNRPKNVPAKIYSDRQQENDQKETDREVKVGTGKNYDQVTVPRNVAFSADEIYNQAYKGMHPNQQPMNVPVSNGHYVAGPIFQSGPQYQGPFVSSTGPAPSMPMTPTTPVGHMSMAYSQASNYPNSPGFLTYSGDFSSFGGTYLRQSSNHSAVSDHVPIPHTPNQTGLPPQMAFSSAYPNYTDHRNYSVPVDPRHSVLVDSRHGVPVMAPEQAMFVPHPPASIPLGHMNVSASHSSPIGVPNNSYQYPVMMMSPGSASGIGQQFFYPQPPPMPPNMGAQMSHPYQMTSGGAQLYNSNQVPYPDSGKNMEVKADVYQPPPTPSTSNAEVQTDREGSPDNREKNTLVEESTFTSVSQIPDNEKFVPHPPAKKKEGRPSPRWSHKGDRRSGSDQDSKRHIDGIRQHHEQRRKEHEVERMTEDQIIENQKRFAKASLDRYFSSLENVYQSSTNLKTSELPHETGLPEVDDESESEIPQNGANDLIEKTVDVVEDVMSNVLVNVDKFHEQKSEKVEVKAKVVEKTKDQSEKYDIRNSNTGVIHENFDVADFKREVTFDEKRAGNDQSERNMKVSNDFKTHELRDEIDFVEKDLDNEKDNDRETLVGSMVNTDVTVQGGGLTDRLKDLGIDVSHSYNKDPVSGKNKKNIKKKGDKKSDRKGKVLIVCPECQGLNKQYMSWCTQCGEMIIGVDPMMVSKNRDGKIRTKPLTKEEDKLGDDIRIQDSVAVGKEIVIDRHSEPVEVNYVQHVDEKPFTLNLETIKSDKDDADEVLFPDSKKGSPIKSDGKDSGRPSSDDPDVEIQTQKIEEEVVNDIYATIADPVLKAHVKSHFNKSKNTAEDFKEQNERNKGVKSFHHDIVDLNRETTGMANVHVLPNDDDDFEKSTVGNSWIDNVKISQQNDNAHVNVSSKIDMFEMKHNYGTKSKTFSVDNENEKEELCLNGDKDTFTVCEPEFFASPPPVPNFSVNGPALHNELSLKIPTHSMDYSTDMSQIVSQNFDAPDEKGDNVEDRKRKEKAERKQERRRRKGHGAIDVEVFGYEESRESRNSSRANRMVPMLNLAGNSSDEDDSAHADFKPYKPDSKQAGSKFQIKSSMNAWEPEVNEFPIEQPFAEAFQPIKEENTIQVNRSSAKPGNEFQAKVEISAAPAERPVDMMVTSDVDESARSEPSTNQYKAEGGQDETWKVLFDPGVDQQESQDEPMEIQEDVEDSVVDDSQPFLMQIINQSKPQKFKQRPKSAGGKPVKSKVRQSIEEPGYQRKWNRSSTAWNSYNPGELNTRSSTDLSRSRASSLPRSRALVSSDNKTLASQDSLGQNSTDSPSVQGSIERGRRPVSAPKSRAFGSNMQASADSEADHDFGASQQPRSSSVTTGRPFSADFQKRKGTKKKSTKGGHLGESFDLDLDFIEHRLPKPSMIERLNAIPAETHPEVPELMLSPKSTYDRLIEMTPRIQAGTVSKWQCLPDELLLHIFAYLDQTSLTKCAQVCQQFYRVAMDESLWKYITIKKSDIDDNCLEEIAKRHPVSLALIQCYGDEVTAKGLRDLFKDCAASLKELNVARCSRGALHGDSLMLHAAARCHNLTHIDASWCALTDSGLMAISNCCHRIESLCINGCNAVSNDGLETTIKKHGTSLRVLEMFGCFNLSPRGLRSVANNCINLISLNLGQCYKLTDSCISQLSTSLGRVESLDLRGCKQIKDNCIRRIVKNCPRLKNLSLANCPSITDVSVLEISTYLTDIRSLDLCGCKNVTDGSIRALVNTCSNLRHIDISSTSCTHRSVSMIANFSGRRLETLKINFLSDITEQSLIKLAKHCHRLKSVHLYGCSSVRNVNKVREEHPSFKIEM